MKLNSKFNTIVYTTDSNQNVMKDKPSDRNTYNIVSKVGYLIGVPAEVFRNEHSPLKIEVFEEMDGSRDARIIRSLCMLRTAVEKNYRDLNYQMAHCLRSFGTCTEYVPSAAITQLRGDGVTLDKANCPLNHYIIEINALIVRHISACRSLFPVWLNWDYLRDIFIMPGGSTEDGIKKAASVYYANVNSYPYQVYVNWNAREAGNILYNDKKFLSLLYDSHGDRFTELGKVSDADAETKNAIYAFLEDHERLVMIVDCENVDPYAFYSALQGLDQDALLDNVSRLILIDDDHTSSAWDLLQHRISIPTEHISVPRVTERKSLVDQALILRASREYYANAADAFILVSSDSDYWPLIHSFEEADFFFMCEDGKLGASMRERLKDEEIPFCWLNDFCADHSTELKYDALNAAICDEINSRFPVSIEAVLDNAIEQTRADLTAQERKTLLERYMKSMRLVFTGSGELSVCVGL